MVFSNYFGEPSGSGNGEVGGALTPFYLTRGILAPVGLKPPRRLKAGSNVSVRPARPADRPGRPHPQPVKATTRGLSLGDARMNPPSSASNATKGTGRPGGGVVEENGWATRSRLTRKDRYGKPVPREPARGRTGRAVTVVGRGTQATGWNGGTGKGTRDGAHHGHLQIRLTPRASPGVFSPLPVEPAYPYVHPPDASVRTPDGRGEASPMPPTQHDLHP